MGRAPCCDKANVKKGPWSPDEDAKLKAFIDQHGTGGNWITLPSKAGLKRCGKSCRLRWINYLRPDIKHGNFTEDEELMIYRLHANIGSRWSLIAAQLPGRTDNDIKNYWNTRLKKKLSERNLEQHYQQQSPASNIQHSSSTSQQQQHETRLAKENNNSQAADHSMTTSSLSFPPCNPPHTPLDATISMPQNNLISIMKSHQYLSSPPSLPEFHSPQMAQDIASPNPNPIAQLMTSVEQQKMADIVKSEDLLSAAVESSDHLLKIWGRQPLSHSSPTPSSASSGISTDRNTYTPAGLDRSESNINAAECSVYSSEEQQQQSGHGLVGDSDALLPVMVAPSPTLSIDPIHPHHPLGAGADDVPALDFSSKLGDVHVGGLLDDDMIRTPFGHEDSCQNQGEGSLLHSGNTVKGEELSFDREEPNWWPAPQLMSMQRTSLINPKYQQQNHEVQQQIQQQQFFAFEQQQFHRYEDAMMCPGRLSLDPSIPNGSYGKPHSWNHGPSSSCNSNALMSGLGIIPDYSIHHHHQQMRHYGPQFSWPDAMNWQETR
ncbi:hypothetical protein R1sor_014914 [Riccia sorocarpa]|uniref:Uncharacterized protein n=1 Tax=Riccia sorocarpa TaxID=122646 RepID=A0ABD3HAR2_9MARC